MTAKNLPGKPRYPVHGWLGLLILAGGEAALLLGNAFVATWFTPIMWTGYILAIDGLVYRIQGSSWLTTRRREFPFLVLFSVLVWLLFEAYNLRLQNWIYHGLPSNPIGRDLGYFWSFATIMPAVFETADLIAILLRRSRSNKRTEPRTLRPGPSWVWFVLGIAFVIIPPLMPQHIARFLFAFVWIGFILLLDPINERLGAPSLRAQMKSGDATVAIALLAAGMACGFIWEAWNFQAVMAEGAYWVYTVPEPLRIFGWHFGKMPVLGLLGFPPFALELDAFYMLIRKTLDLDRLIDFKKPWQR
ncbi:MAG: hypothetical protein PVJ07_00100 [Anaerolineales bacterium]|jgi:hypothetical protein